MKFPENFYWGAATSAHQIEGGNHNDWSEWEHASAERLARGGRTRYGNLKNWSDIQAMAEEPANYISGRACDHYHRFREDFDIAKSLGHNAHRFSIEWSRIEPEEGKFDEKEIEHYREVIRALRERGMEPFVTLWHWTIPIWLRDKGGIESYDFPYYFARFVERTVHSFKDDIQFWITLNEPLVNANIAFLEGRWPPQKKNLFSFLRVSRNLVRAHKNAYITIKSAQPDAQVGIAHNMSFFELAHDTVLNRILKRIGEWRKNFVFLNAIAGYQDFIGFNYYSHYHVDRGFRKIETQEKSDMGWSLYPKGIYLMLQSLKKYHKPIYITENGLADAADKHRTWAISEHIKWIKQASQDGVDVRGYFHWSLLDNFEWSDGFWPRFGLVEVDYKTMERKIRPSAFEYKKIIESRGENVHM